MNQLETITTFEKYTQAKSLSELLKAIGLYFEELYKKSSPLVSKISHLDFLSVQQKFKAVIDSCNSGDMQKALQILDAMLHKTTGSCLLDRNDYLKKNSILYRMRYSENYELYHREDMFHMPFEKAGVQAAGRYSISGVPCLYLGASLYSCWEETRRPDITKVNYAAFTNKRKLHFLSTMCPNTLDSLDDLRRFFIFALCSAYVRPEEDHSKHRFQYVISELITILFIRYLHAQDEAKKPVKYDGIKYISSRYFLERDMFKIRPIFYNYVIPIRNVQKEGHCPVLVNTFNVSEVKAEFARNIRLRKLSGSKIRVNEYSQSLFAMLEDELTRSRSSFLKIKDKV